MASEPKKRKTKGSGKHCVVVGCSNNRKNTDQMEARNLEKFTTPKNMPIARVLVFSHTKIMHRIPTRSRAHSEAKINQWIININRKHFIPRNKSTASSVSLCY